MPGSRAALLVLALAGVASAGISCLRTTDMPTLEELRQLHPDVFELAEWVECGTTREELEARAAEIPDLVLMPIHPYGVEPFRQVGNYSLSFSVDWYSDQFSVSVPSLRGYPPRLRRFPCPQWTVDDAYDGAGIFVDGREAGRLSGKGSYVFVPEGRHSILVRKPGLPPRVEHLDVEDAMDAGFYFVRLGVPSPVPVRLDVAASDLESQVLVREISGKADVPVEVERVDDPPQLRFQLLPGRYAVSFEKPDGSRALELISIRDGATEFCRSLSLEPPPSATPAGEPPPPPSLAGEVATALGTAAGAQVLVLSRTSTPGEPHVERIATDASGRFRTNLPRNVEAVDLVVLVPGASARLVHLARLPDGPVRLLVSGLAGDLTIEAPPGPLTLRQDGAVIPAELFSDWTGLRGGPSSDRRSRIPQLAAGTYSVCSNDTCREIDLSAGEALVVRIEPLGSSSSEPLARRRVDR